MQSLCGHYIIFIFIHISKTLLISVVLLLNIAAEQAAYPVALNEENTLLVVRIAYKKHADESLASHAIVTNGLVVVDLNVSEVVGVIGGVITGMSEISVEFVGHSDIVLVTCTPDGNVP